MRGQQIGSAYVIGEIHVIEGYNMSRADSDNESLPRWVQIIPGILCILSLLGSLAIILTYAFVKDIRSKARELLVHVSLMDFTYTTANLVGLSLPYYKYLSPNDTTRDARYNVYWVVCQVQAFFAVYGTIGSVLWTLGLAVYLYYRIVARYAAVTRRLVKVLYVVCYVLPLYVSLWLLLDRHLGYSHEATSGAGWCFVNRHVTGLELFMTYDIWMWLGVIILIPLYLTTHIHARLELKKLKTHLLIAEDPSGVIRAERKLLLVPLVFIFLRIWDIIGDISIIHKNFHIPVHGNWFRLLTAIGDSGQGLFNFIIFFLFQQRLRTLMINVTRHYCCCGCCRRRRRPSLFTDRVEGDKNVRNNDQMRQPGDILFSQNTPH